MRAASDLLYIAVKILPLALAAFLRVDLVAARAVHEVIVRKVGRGRLCDRLRKRVVIDTT